MTTTQASAILNYFIKKQSEFTLQDVYNAFQDFPRPSIRRVLRQNKAFEVIGRGIYRLNTIMAEIYLIKGDSRHLDMIEDSSVDLIVADHPWSDSKASKGGNRNLTEGYHETEFNYINEDFKHKARVLKTGGYLIEILPTEKHSNFEYLYELKKMALKNGFLYYAKIMWQKSPSNTGRTVKEFEDIMIFSKGKAKRINNDKRLGYTTRKMLKQRIYAPVPKRATLKNHRAEKPSELWQYLFNMFTHPLDIIIDQFGGSCNTIDAALKTNRNLIVFDILKEYIDNAVERFNMKKVSFN